MLNRILLCLWLNAIFVGPTHAYLDGGTGGMLLQLLFGGVTGAVIIVKMYWQSLVGFFKGHKSNDVDVSNLNKEKKESKTQNAVQKDDHVKPNI